MSETPKHSPMTLRIVDCRHQQNGQIRIFRKFIKADGYESHVANVLRNSVDAEEIAAEIVQAVNSHALLQEAEKALEAQGLRDNHLPNPFGHDCQWCADCCDRVEAMRANVLADLARLRAAREVKA